MMRPIRGQKRRQRKQEASYGAFYHPGLPGTFRPTVFFAGMVLLKIRLSTSWSPDPPTFFRLSFGYRLLNLFPCQVVLGGRLAMRWAVRARVPEMPIWACQ